jgi:hypothetical protein
VPSGVPTASSKVAFACRSQCQFTPVNPSFLQVGSSCRLMRLCRSKAVPLSVLNTKVSGFTAAGLRAERISMHFAPREPTADCADSWAHRKRPHKPFESHAAHNAPDQRPASEALAIRRSANRLTPVVEPLSRKVPAELLTVPGFFGVDSSFFFHQPSPWQPSFPNRITRNQLRYFGGGHHRPKDGPHTLDRSQRQSATLLAGIDMYGNSIPAPVTSACGSLW